MNSSPNPTELLLEELENPGKEIYFNHSVLEYFSLLFTLPSHTALILLQAQYIPRDIELESTSYHENEMENDDGDQNNAGDYYNENERYYSTDDDEDDHMKYPEKCSANLKDLKTDELGYFIPSERTRPAYQLPPLRSGIGNTVSILASFRYEGLFSLWKIAFPYWITLSIDSFISPSIEDNLNDYFDLYDPSIVPLHYQQNFWPNLSTRITSRVLSKLILSPLDIVTTNMAVQTSDPLHSKYNTTWNAFWKLFVYPTPNSRPSLFLKRMYPFPTFTFLMHLFKESLEASKHLILRRYLGYSPTSTPITYALHLLALETLGLLIYSPMRTIWTRITLSSCHTPLAIKADNLTVLDENDVHQIPACVRLSSIPYKSPLDCLKRIVTEEAIGYPRDRTKASHKLKQQRRYKSGFLGGIMQFYRGFWYKTTLISLECALLVVVNLSITSDVDYHYY